MNVTAPDRVAAASIRSNSFFSAALADADPEIARAIELELGRQRDGSNSSPLKTSYRAPCSKRRARSSPISMRKATRQTLLRRLPVRRHRREFGD